MKRTLLFALALVAVGCAEPIPRNWDELVLQGDDTFLDRETMRGYTGPVFLFDVQDSTRLSLIANLKDGKLDGPHEYYFVNGSLQKQTYMDGELHGPYQFYADDGELVETGTFNMGERCGEWIEGRGREPVTYPPC